MAIIIKRSALPIPPPQAPLIALPKRRSRTVDARQPSMRDPNDGTYFYGPAGTTHADVLAALKEKFPDRKVAAWEQGWVDRRKLTFTGIEEAVVQPVL